MPMYEAELLDEERDAVQNLLNYLDSGKWSMVNAIWHFFLIFTQCLEDSLSSLDICLLV